MVKPYGFREDELLSECLRQEAMASRPQFSERLHQRLCRAVRQCEARQLSTLPQPVALRRVGRWALAAAAAIVLLAMAAFVWQSIDRDPMTTLPQESEVASAIAVDPSAGLDGVTDLASQAAENLDNLVDSAIAAQRWAQLDHDARVVIETLADRLPFEVPTTLVLSEIPDQLQ